jgi:hypothetical protein
MTHVASLTTRTPAISTEDPTYRKRVNGEHGGFLLGAQREFCRTWPNQQEVARSESDSASYLKSIWTVAVGHVWHYSTGALKYRLRPSRQEEFQT